MEEKINSKVRSDTITISKDKLWKYSTFALLGVIVLGVIFFVLPDKSPTGNVIQQQPQGLPSPSAKVEVSIDDDPVLGEDDAEVTIIEFSDYQCPFCRKFWQDTFTQLKTDYIDTGKAKFVYRDYPLNFHPMAVPAAEAANCAREKGGDKAYYEMHDKMFEEQNILDGGTVQSTVQFTKEDLKKWAKDIGYNIDSCLDSGKYTKEVQDDFADGGSAGVQGTPAFFINGRLLSGAQPYAAFKQAIDAELN